MYDMMIAIFVVTWRDARQSEWQIAVLYTSKYYFTVEFN